MNKTLSQEVADIRLQVKTETDALRLSECFVVQQLLDWSSKIA